MAETYKPNKKFKFTFGLWTVGNIGRDPFGGPVRQAIDARQICDLVGDAGAYGVNFHDNDLIPIDATPERAAEIKKKLPCRAEGQRPGRADGDDQLIRRCGV